MAPRPHGAALVASLLSLFVTACADRQRPVGDGGSERDGGEDGSKGGLEDHVAGKACFRDLDCTGAGGECLAQFDHGALGDVIPPQYAPGGYCSAPCTRDDECGEGARCTRVSPDEPGRCEATCSDASDCRSGYVCSSLSDLLDAMGLPDGGVGLLPEGNPLPAPTCIPAPMDEPLEDGVVGTRCTADDDCGELGKCLDALILFEIVPLEPTPGGYCSIACLEDSHCGEGGICAGHIGSLPGWCLLGCESDDDCFREDYVCRPQTNLVLTSIPRACRAAAPPLPDRAAGAPCSDDEACSPGTCNRQVERGFCSQDCTRDIECGEGGTCVQVGESFGFCAEACQRAGDCSRDDYICLPQREASLPGFCRPPSRDFDDDD